MAQTSVPVVLEQSVRVEHKNLEIKQAFANPTASGNTQVVAAVSGAKIRVVGGLVTNAGASPVKVKFQSATTDISAAHEMAADGGGFRLEVLTGFFCETVAGAALNINLGAAGDVGVTLNYVEV